MSDNEELKTEPQTEMADGAPRDSGSDAPPQLENADANDQIAPVPRFVLLTEPESSETAPKRGR